MKERFDRYDDAVKAVACALEEGIVEGGGLALAKSNIGIQMYDNKIHKDKTKMAILDSLLNPYMIIFKDKWSIKDGKYNFNISENMFEQNIIDPLKVTRCALLNAVSVAKTILSTEAVVLNSEEWMK